MMSLYSGRERGRILWLLLFVAIGAALGPLTVPWLSGNAAAMVQRCRAVMAAFEFPGDLGFFLHQLYWLPVALLCVGILYAAHDRWKLQRRLGRFLARHAARQPGSNEVIYALAAAAGVPDRVLISRGGTPAPAFTAGLIRPRIYLSEALSDTLAPEELRAVFLHEFAHLRRRDPLRIAVYRFLARALFWLPLVSVWMDALAEDIEVAADDDAGHDEPLALAGAIVKVARITTDRIGDAVPAMGDATLVDRRVRRLLGRAPAIAVPLPVGPLAYTACVLAVLWAIGLSVIFVPM